MMRCALEILLESTRSTGREHPHLGVTVENHGGILAGMGQAPEQVRARLDEIGRLSGISLSALLGRPQLGPGSTSGSGPASTPATPPLT
jgi:hypothetical protein